MPTYEVELMARISGWRSTGFRGASASTRCGTSRRVHPKTRCGPRSGWFEVTRRSRTV